MILFKKYMLYLAIISPFINLCVADCDEDYKNAMNVYDDCMTKSNIHYLITKENVQIQDLCRLFEISEDCTEKSEHIIKNCSAFEESQLVNHIAGLKAFRSYKCGKNILDEDKNKAIIRCEKLQENEQKKCDSRLKYNYSLFLPLPVVKMRFTEDLWTEKDCRKKFRWADCWIKAYDNCKDKTAKLHYGKLFTTILRAYPSCKRVLKKILDDYEAENGTNLPTFSCFVFIISLLYTKLLM